MSSTEDFDVDGKTVARVIADHAEDLKYIDHDAVMTHMRKNGMIESNEYAEVRKRSSEEKRLFLEEQLPRKGDAAFRMFLKCLRDSGQVILARKMKNPMSSTEDFDVDGKTVARVIADHAEDLKYIDHDAVLTHMRKNGMIESNEYAEVRKRSSEEKRLFLEEHLPRKGDAAFRMFLKCLRDSGQVILARKMKNRCMAILNRDQSSTTNRHGQAFEGTREGGYESRSGIDDHRLPGEETLEAGAPILADELMQTLNDLSNAVAQAKNMAERFKEQGVYYARKFDELEQRLRREQYQHRETERNRQMIEMELKKRSAQVEELQRQLDVGKTELPQARGWNIDTVSQAQMPMKDELFPWQLTWMPTHQTPRCRVQTKADLFTWLRKLSKQDLVVSHVYSHTNVKTGDVEEIESRIAEKMSHWKRIWTFLDANLDEDWAVDFFGIEENKKGESLSMGCGVTQLLLQQLQDDFKEKEKKLVNENMAMKARMEEMSKALAKQKEMKVKHKTKKKELKKQLEKEQLARQEAERKKRVIKRELKESRAQVEDLQQKLLNSASENEKRELEEQLKREQSLREETARQKRKIKKELKKYRAQVEELQQQFASVNVKPSHAHPKDDEIPPRTPLPMEHRMHQSHSTQAPRCHVKSKDELLALLNKDKDSPRIVFINAYSHTSVRMVEVEKMEKKIKAKMSDVVFLDVDLDSDWTENFFVDGKLDKSGHWIIVMSQAHSSLDAIGEILRQWDIRGEYVGFAWSLPQWIGCVPREYVILNGANTTCVDIL
ncbi:unnamed protein product [Darwinula stevensoni]|uniref:CARD domain-containing protein n=1 Tax=Darwinula stevensoni TaxID=69355 RepID=A0A7R9A756_9CRUS|nr:unnamed protein product [Darwinula stevensoni]CAG0891635.1 unnamed protein product [Darwinula stevensoni]